MDGWTAALVRVALSHHTGNLKVQTSYGNCLRFAPRRGRLETGGRRLRNFTFCCTWLVTWGILRMCVGWSEIVSLHENRKQLALCNAGWKVWEHVFYQRKLARFSFKLAKFSPNLPDLAKNCQIQPKHPKHVKVMWKCFTNQDFADWLNKGPCIGQSVGETTSGLQTIDVFLQK